MRYLRRLKYLTTIILAVAFVAAAWTTTALAQVPGGDGDGADGDELSMVAIVVAVAAIAVIGWVVNNRRSTKPR